MEYMVDSEVVLFATQNGAILTIDEKGTVDIKAQNDDGLTGGSVSPTQQYIYLVTKNKTLIQLTPQLDPLNQIPLEEETPTESPCPDSPNFSWKPDGSYFALNIKTSKGRKCLTRDSMLGLFRSPSKSDPEGTEGLVKSVSERGWPNMGGLVAWQPSGGIIAGVQSIGDAANKKWRVIFWEKNGLRHLEFDLAEEVTDVLNLSWSQDSSILYIQLVTAPKTRQLHLYSRHNYTWHHKSTHPLPTSPTTLYLPLKQKHNQLLLLSPNCLTSYQFNLQTTKNNWLTAQQEKEKGCVLQVSVDGRKLRITDFAKGVLPHPMCHWEGVWGQQGGWVSGVGVWGQVVVVCVGGGNLGEMWVGMWDGKELVDRYQVELGEQVSDILNPINFRISSHTPTQTHYTLNNSTYSINHKTHKSHLVHSYTQYPVYTVPFSQSAITFTSSLCEQTLTINEIIYSEHCTSYIFYHEFLIFTVQTNGMYDKMFVFDLELQQRNSGGGGKIQVGKVRMQEVQAKKSFNYRTIQRGAKILGCSKNHITLQLPRGNFQTITPKLLTIKSIPSLLESHKYLQAFTTLRTHKLDFNLLFDIDPQAFTSNIKEVLTCIERTDYLNLFISQLRDQISAELLYCVSKDIVEDRKEYVQIGLQGKKINHVCRIIADCLRSIDMDKYILSVFTSEIKMGLVDQVLFEILERKKKDVEQVVPPHLQPNQPKKKKQLSSQEVLEYVCWLVDANAIYQASLLTYDLQLASMTARCTQMDPKEYIPYLQQLKQITDPIELRHKICTDLKNYPKAIEQLSKGSPSQIRTSITYIQKHKLYKCGLQVYANQPQYLREVKILVVDELVQMGDHAEAYRMCMSVGEWDRALQIAKKMLDGGKIREVLDCDLGKTAEHKVEIVRAIVEGIGEDGFKNKGDLAELKRYLGLYDEATTLFVRAGNYIQAFKTYMKTTQQYKNTRQLENGMLLLCSLQKNHLLKEKTHFLEKTARLQKVHRLRAVQGPTLNIRNLDNDDMYSEVSVSSKAASEYTVSTTTGLRKKKDKKKSILSRNIKQGSPLEQQYLVTYLHNLLQQTQQTIKQTKQLIQHLIYLNLIGQAQSLRNTCREYGQVASKCQPKYYAQLKFQADHPQFLELLTVYQSRGEEVGDKGKERRERFAVDSFNYLF